jgi:ribosomal protein S18 acetylase RimI-like enzyme
MVRPFVNPDELERFGVQRGWCENISTRAPWRGRGVASALIARALRALRERGMTEAALGVDAQNETGALRLYQRMGFIEVARETEWRRPLLPGGTSATTPGTGA